LPPYPPIDGWADASLHVPSALRYSSLRIERLAARQLIADGALLIDVRRGEDGLDSPDGALRITPDAIPERLGAFSREVPIVLGCT
jgi:rhodanese-related sulfurtransferase